jgi:hypothetical protein
VRAKCVALKAKRTIEGMLPQITWVATRVVLWPPGCMDEGDACVARTGLSRGGCKVVSVANPCR